MARGVHMQNGFCQNFPLESKTEQMTPDDLPRRCRAPGCKEGMGMCVRAGGRAFNAYQLYLIEGTMDNSRWHKKTANLVIIEEEIQERF